jgi:uncharacterized membrane protein YGL010W
VKRPAAGERRADRIDALLAEYGAAHRAAGNLACHAAGITLIVFGILSLAHAVRLGGGWTGSELVVALAGAAYLALDVPLGIAMLGTAALVDLVARVVDDSEIGAAAFALGWILQAIGHAVYEKNSPAFFRNLVHLLVGPAYLVNKVLRIRPAATATP